MTHPASAFDLPGWKHRLAETRQALGRGWAGGESFAALVDDLVRELGCRAGWDGPNRAVAAQGGYGRSELAPRSDLDILFLVKNQAAPPPLDQVLYPLWDLGFEVGHALRTPRQCADLARSDLTAATALMDARVILGDATLLQAAWARASIRSGGSPEMRRWAWRILEDVEERRIRFGEVSHLLEPHLKEGRGGLRDHQATVWVLRCLGGEVAESVRRLPESGPTAEAWGFIGRARAALHAAAGRKTDHLTIDYHREVAARTAPGEPRETFFSRPHRARPPR
ncbi:MAG: [protein-PII] uridylyltransferase family protein, partial [Deferrisomatales bacterium]